MTNTFLFARDDYRCQYCHRTQADLRHRECLTRDHLVPLSRGGINTWTNDKRVSEGLSFAISFSSMLELPGLDRYLGAVGESP